VVSSCNVTRQKCIFLLSDCAKEMSALRWHWYINVTTAIVLLRCILLLIAIYLVTCLINYVSNCRSWPHSPWCLSVDDVCVVCQTRTALFVCVVDCWRRVIRRRVGAQWRWRWCLVADFRDTTTTRRRQVNSTSRHTGHTAYDKILYETTCGDVMCFRKLTEASLQAALKKVF